MSVAIKVESRVDDPRYIKNMDFSIFIDGESDNTLYRMEDGAKSFKKLYSIGKAHGYAVRGNKRKIIQELVNNIFNTEIPFAIAITK